MDCLTQHACVVNSALSNVTLPIILVRVKCSCITFFNAVSYPSVLSRDDYHD